MFFLSLPERKFCLSPTFPQLFILSHVCMIPLETKASLYHTQKMIARGLKHHHPLPACHLQTPAIPWYAIVSFFPRKEPKELTTLSSSCENRPGSVSETSPRKKINAGLPQRFSWIAPQSGTWFRIEVQTMVNSMQGYPVFMDVILSPKIERAWASYHHSDLSGLGCSKIFKQSFLLARYGW